MTTTHRCIEKKYKRLGKFIINMEKYDMTKI